MIHAAPLGILEQGAEAILVSDGYGAVRYMNHACATLLKCDPRTVLGKPCWTVARMRTRDDNSFCGPDCPVQKLVRSGKTPSPQNVVYPSPDGSLIDLLLFTVLIPPASSPRHPLLHMMSPVPSPARRSC